MKGLTRIACTVALLTAVTASSAGATKLTTRRPGEGDPGIDISCARGLGHVRL